MTRATRVLKRDLATQCGIRDSEMAKLWRIQATRIAVCGKEAVSVEVYVEKDKRGISAWLRMGVREVDLNMASGKAAECKLRATLHPEGAQVLRGEGSVKAAIIEDNPECAVPLHHPRR